VTTAGGGSNTAQVNHVWDSGTRPLRLLTEINKINVGIRQFIKKTKQATWDRYNFIGKELAKRKKQNKITGRGRYVQT